MNEQDQKLIEMYSKYVKKKRIIIALVIFVLIIIGIIVFKVYFYDKISNIEDIIQVNVDENILNELSNNTNENIISDEISEIKQEIQEETKQNDEVKKENTSDVKETKQETQTTTQPTSTKKVEEPKPQKPNNKDFLFTDGYTMDNVTEAAEKYLKSSGYAGECIPLKDDEGIYTGMRVIFY